MSPSSAERQEGMSPELDSLGATLAGDALNLLADGRDLNVLLVVQARDGTVTSYDVSDDGVEACLMGARETVRSLAADAHDPAAPVRYAIAYEGAVADDDGSYHDALMLEFGERGYRAYSAYSLVAGRGAHEDFQWSDPAPAGEIDPLL
ncbi:hypothetical protein [Olsenella massiliensis]|uniref:hypothetical protein n=1 Tax=Olsenella massiliensis TaxID=1622075 RepID=UPI00071CC777|nr:hypothetical protein [Olsenella massiliensis]